MSLAKIIDMSYRKCSICQSNKTSMVKTRVGLRPNWYIDNISLQLDINISNLNTAFSDTLSAAS